LYIPTFYFALLASYVANHIRVICPSGLLRSTNSFLMNLSSNSGRKVTKRTPPDQFALRVPEAFAFAYGPS
jgi:hypothetical protein